MPTLTLGSDLRPNPSSSSSEVREKERRGVRYLSVKPFTTLITLPPMLRMACRRIWALHCIWRQRGGGGRRERSGGREKGEREREEEREGGIERLRWGRGIKSEGEWDREREEWKDGWTAMILKMGEWIKEAKTVNEVRKVYN
jgi:hypothetical protein